MFIYYYSSNFFPFTAFGLLLTLNVPCISESCIEIKVKLNFYFQTSLWWLKMFYLVVLMLNKPFEAPQRSVKCGAYLVQFALLKSWASLMHGLY